MNALDTYGSACLLGLAGMGKTTLARYVYTMLKERGDRVVYVTSDESKTIEFNVAKDRKVEIRCVNLRDVWRRDKEEDEIVALANAIVRAIEGTFFDRLKGKAKKALAKLAEKIGVKVEELDRVKIDLSKVQAYGEIVDRLYDWFDSVFGEEVVKTLGGVAKIRSKIGEFLKTAQSNDMFHLLFEMTLFVTAGLVTASVAKSVLDVLKSLKSERKLENVAIVVDDIADFDEHEMVNFVKFLKVMSGEGVKVLLVKRLDDSTKEGFGRYLELMEFLSRRHKGLDLDLVLFRGAKDYFDVDLRKRIFLLDSAEKEEFSKMLEANVYTKERIEEKLGIGYDEALDLIYRASAGTICIALYMLEMGFKAEDMRRIASSERYYSWSEIAKCEDEAKRRKMVESNKALRFEGIYEIYKRLSENPCYIALVFSDLAEDELEMLCDRIGRRFGGCRPVSYRDEYFWILGSYEEVWEDEEGRDIKRKVYRLKDWWRKFEVFVDALCEYHEYGQDIEEDLKVIIDAIVDVFDEEVERTGGGWTGRMIVLALKNLKWLLDKGSIRPKSTFLWVGLALQNLPRVGLDFLPIVLQVWKDRRDEIVEDRDVLLYALSFARDLAEYGKFLLQGEGYLAIYAIVEDLLNVNGDDAVLCWKAWTYSSLADGMIHNGFKDMGEWCLKRAEDLLNEIGEPIENLAKIKVLIAKGRVESIMIDPEKAIETFKECLKIVEGLSFDERFVDVFKPLGGNAKEKFDLQVREWKRSIYLELGRANFKLNLDESERFFMKGLELLDEQDIARKLVVLGHIGRINVLRSYSFEFYVGGERWDFKRLWRLCSENVYTISNEYLACICAQYLVYAILKNEFEGNEELLSYLDMFYPAKALFYALSHILDLELKGIGMGSIVSMLRDLDLSMFPKVSDPKAQIHLEEIEMEVEGMYDSHLSGNMRDYNAYKRLVWDKTLTLPQTLARLMFFYIVGDLKTAMDLAKKESRAYSKSKVPSELLREFGEAIKEEMEAKSDAEREMAKERVRRAFVKLFYYTI